MDSSCPQKSFLLDLTLFCKSYFWLHALLFLILHNYHKLVAHLSDWRPENHILDTTNFLWYVSINEPYLCPFHAVGLTFCANITFCHFHIGLYFPLSDFYLPLEVTSLQGNIYLPSRRTLCSHFFFLASRIILAPFFLYGHIVFSIPYCGSFQYNPRDDKKIIDRLMYVYDVSKLDRLHFLKFHIYCTLQLTIHLLTIFDCHVYPALLNVGWIFLCVCDVRWQTAVS